MVSRGRHPKSAVASALSKAKAAGLIVEEDRNGHRWGRVRCPTCASPFTIAGTPQNPDNHAKKIDAFIARHDHKDHQIGNAQ